MHSLCSAFVPIWALTAIGYLVARGGVLGPHGGAVLGRFVFLVAIRQPGARRRVVSGGGRAVPDPDDHSDHPHPAGRRYPSFGAEEPGAEEPGACAELAVVVVLKTLVQPVLGYVVGRWVFGLPPHDLLAVVLCSALPTAQNAFIYAREYGLRTALARDAIVVSTLLSMVTLSLIAWLLGTGR